MGLDFPKDFPKDIPKEHFPKDLKEHVLEELVAESKEPKGEYLFFDRPSAVLRRAMAPTVLAYTGEPESQAQRRPRSTRSRRPR